MNETFRRIYIFAGSHKQATNFAREKGLHLGDWIFLHSPDQIRGLRKESYIRVGTYYNQKNTLDIERALLEADMIEVSDIRIKDNP